MNMFLFIILILIHIASAESGLSVIKNYTGTDTIMVIIYLIRTVVTQIVTIVLIWYLAVEMEKESKD